MPSNSSILPRKWFFLAAAIALLLATISTSVVFWSTSVKKENLPVPAGQNKSFPTPPPKQEEPPDYSLNQTGPDDEIIPWGGVSTSDFVTLEVVPSRADLYNSANIQITRNGENYSPGSTDAFSVSLKQLPPGDYRWSVVLRASDGKDTGPLLPPRATPNAVDFVIKSPALEMHNLRQTKLDGSPIRPLDLSTEAGAILGADINRSDAKLEVEVKMQDIPFDETALLTSSVPIDGRASVTFSGPDGRYHWRARAIGSTGEVSPWAEMHFTELGDFTIIDPLPSDENPPSDDNTPRHGDKALMSLARDGDGPRDPNPSIVPEHEPFWSLISSNALLSVAVASIALCAVLGGMMGRSRKPPIK